jgi:hypothetical protein
MSLAKFPEPHGRENVNIVSGVFADAAELLWNAS